MVDNIGVFGGDVRLGPYEPNNVYHADALEFLQALPDASVDAIITDPPYFRIKDEPWDNAWDNQELFLMWLNSLVIEWNRILVSNGSLYIFAAPRMAAQIEVILSKHLNILNSIVWYKTSGNRNWSADKTQVRSFLPNTERLIFAEHYHADNRARGELDTARGFLFEPIRKYLDDERTRAGKSFEDIRQIVGCAAGSGLPSHWFTRSQWMLPTKENYMKLQAGFNNAGIDEYLRREYEELRREYEELRRPFNMLPKTRNFTDVWFFRAVQDYPGKHPCEKPVDLLYHIITISTKPGNMILDCFVGHGTTCLVAKHTARQFIGCDNSKTWIDKTRVRLSQNTFLDLLETESNSEQLRLGI